MRLLPVCLLFLIPPSLQAAPPTPVSTTGNVWTNQVALPSGHFARNGDKLRTDSTGMAVLTTPETGRFEVRMDSDVTWLDDGVRLDAGTVASAKLPVQLGEYEIAPANPSEDSWFVVSETEGETLVAAYRGDVVIRGGGAGPITVPAGSFAMAAAATPEPEPAPAPQASGPTKPSKSKDKAKGRNSRQASRRRTGRANSAGSSKGWSIGGMGHITSVAIVSGVAAAAITGLAGNSIRNESVSPQ